MSDWKQRATELHKKRLSYTQIGIEVGMSRSMVSRHLNYGNEYGLCADDDFFEVRKPRVPKRIIKTPAEMHLALCAFAAGNITRQELMEGIKA